jgi:DNA-binding transcriptional ArsR family regulator
MTQQHVSELAEKVELKIGSNNQYYSTTSLKGLVEKKVIIKTNTKLYNSFSNISFNKIGLTEIISYKEEEYVYKITLVIAAVGGKLDGKDVLNNSRRLSIFNYLIRNPGSHLRQIMNVYNLSPNQTSYHLATLERHGLITSYNDGRFRQFYANQNNLEELPSKELIKILKNENVITILYAIFNNSELSLASIREITHLHRNTIYKLLKQIKPFDVINYGPPVSLTENGIKTLKYISHNTQFKE